jgi:hypothetical protein
MIMMEMATAKISIAIGREELRRAKRQAKQETLSLSAFISRAVAQHLEECERNDAARQFFATYEPDEFATEAERKHLLDLWTRRVKPTKREIYGK